MSWLKYLSIPFFLLTLLFSCILIDSLSYPYNDQGRYVEYSDVPVVYHEQAIPVYSILAIGSVLVGLGLLKFSK